MNARKFFREYVLNIQQVMEPSAAVQVAETLLEHYSGVTRRQMILNPELMLNPETIQPLEAALLRLRQREPVQYITETGWFYDMPFKVSPAVLIPRPETEELVEKVIERCRSWEPLHILDVGTGSGCMAITLKKQLPHASVTAIDVSKAALEIAQYNAGQHHTVIDFKEVDFLNAYARLALNSYSIIVSNPPYIPDEEKTIMDENVVRYEPHLALFASDHLVFYKALAVFGKTNLHPNGYIYCEIHQRYADEVLKVFKTAGYRAVVHPDISGNQRMVEATLTHSR